MTGYGKGEAAREGLRVCVEIQTVNRKQFDVALNIPRSLQILEPRIRETLQARVSRGRLNLNLSLTQAAQSVVSSAIDFELARVYANEMRRLKSELQLEGELTLDTLVRAPGVLTSSSNDFEPEFCELRITKKTSASTSNAIAPL
jgi:uncharacterized protein (TIGR00255 family)